MAADTERSGMRIVVIGGTGLIGSRVVTRLDAQGHQALAASPRSGVNALTGEGLADALSGASVVVDVSNAPSWEDAAVLKFFVTSTTNLLEAEAAASVRHHVALSVVGSERLTESGYFRATQFFEFVKSIADISMVGDKVHLPRALIQPMAADDVASAVALVAMGSP